MELDEPENWVIGCTIVLQHSRNHSASSDNDDLMIFSRFSLAIQYKESSHI